MNIIKLLQFISPFNDASETLSDDQTKGVNPVLDSGFIFKALSLLSKVALVYFGVQLPDASLHTVANDIPTLISLLMVLYAEAMKWSAAYFAAQKAKDTQVKAIENHSIALQAMAECKSSPKA